MLKSFQITPEEYQNTKPYPYFFQDQFLDSSFANALQEEILNLPMKLFDRYQNPFEQKWTLRDKTQFPTHLTQLFNELESKLFIQHLSNLVGFELISDPNRNFYGVHVYEKGDKLDIHVDAGIHPLNRLKKQVTLGIYLSKNWENTFGCDLEIWQGDNAANSHPKLYQCVQRIAPMFNRLVIFTCTDDSWHGNPQPANGTEDSKRIFITLSYLSHNTQFENKKQKAYFIARPEDPVDQEKDRLRQLRADPKEYQNIYR